MVNKKTGKRSIVNADADCPSEGPGESGSVLSELINAGFTDVDVPHDCGGHLSCSSCAAIIKGELSDNSHQEEELDMIDLLKDPAKKRLMCQACPNGQSDITIVIPAKNELK